jgi:hypothetical protein
MPNPIQHTLIDNASQYAYASKEVDPSFPPAPALGKELSINIFFDSDHGNDRKTRRSISGVIVYVGNTPILWKSKHQEPKQTSTYGAELWAMRLVVEEAITICYMLRSFGIPLTRLCRTMGDNERAVTIASSPECQLKKKHVTLLHHSVRENTSIRPLTLVK